VSFVHENPEEFTDLVQIIVGDTGLLRSIIEKDYWVTHTLWASHGGSCGSSPKRRAQSSSRAEPPHFGPAARAASWAFSSCSSAGAIFSTRSLMLAFDARFVGDLAFVVLRFGIFTGCAPSSLGEWPLGRRDARPRHALDAAALFTNAGTMGA
jgi:hypothetical protein